MKKVIAAGLCALFYISLHAQKNLKEGFVVLNNKDTLKGLIDYREWYKTPNSIMFTSSKEKRSQRYKVTDISSFAVNGIELYQRHTVKISMDRQLVVGNSGEKDTSGRTDMVFLRVLQSGKNITLFSYADDVKQRLYILPRDETTPVELQNSEYLSNGQVISENQYRSVLSDIARRFITPAEDIQTLIYANNYSQENISNICYRINGIDKVTVKQEEKNKPSHVRFFAGIGINRGALKFSGNNHYAGATSDASYQPLIAGGADIFINPAVGRMFLRSQLSVSQYKAAAVVVVQYQVSKETYNLTFKQTNLALHEQFNYNFYNSRNFKWSAGAGAGFNFSFYPMNEEKLLRERLTDTSTIINNNYVAFKKNFWLSTILRTSFSIRNLELSVAYYPKSSITNYADYQIDNSSLQLQINYLFH